MRRRFPCNLIVFSMCILLLNESARPGTISGRREDEFGDGIHESFIWFTGIGDNATNAWAIGWSWSGNFTIDNVPAGQYYYAANMHGAHRHNIGSLINVPSSGTVNVSIRDVSTMSSYGLSDVGECQWAAQEFIATGTSVAEVMLLSPNGGSQVRVTIRENDPWGSQIGPHSDETNGSLFPAFAGWAPGEVPTIPGRRYVVRFDRLGTEPWRPAISYRNNEYPNGAAWLDGVYRPEVDLRISVACRDDGFAKEYQVDNWWRSKSFTDLVQTFVPQGDHLRIAQMMLAGQESHLMRVTVHEWNGQWPTGDQIGPAKHGRMDANLKQGVVWGPDEVPLTPGRAYAIRLVRVDGQPFAIYGDSDDYSLGQAYFDGLPDNGIDITGTLVTRERDLGEITVTNITCTAISATEILATFDTDVPTTSAVVYRTESPPFDAIAPVEEDQAPALSHQVVARNLTPGTTYQMYILAHNPGRNVYRSSWSSVATPGTTAAFAGRVYSQIGPVSGATVIFEEADLAATTNESGDFSFNGAPTGHHRLRVEKVAHESATQEVHVTPDGLGTTEIEILACSNMLAGTDNNPIDGWTEFGEFGGQWNSGDWSINARTGPKWVGSVQNGSGGKKGGIYRVISTQSGKDYIFGGWVLTKAWGTSYDPIPGLALARIGVDPTGGTDPDSPSVIWARYRFTDGNWWELTVPFTAGGDQATLFCQHKYETFYLLATWWLAGFDDLWFGAPQRRVPDFDRDGDVDQEDFGLLQACYSGAGITQEAPECQRARLDVDEDVDAGDFIILQGCLTGTGVPVDPACANP